MIKKVIFYSIIIICLSLFFSFALAQESSDSVEEPEIAADDLEVSEPGLFAWVQNVVRDVRIFFTRDPVKKSELQLQKASAQLIRARDIVEENPDDVELQTKLERIDKKYQETIEEINTRVEKFKTANPDDSNLKNFLDKYTDYQLKHQQILERLEEQAPQEVFEIIKDNRQRHLERFGEVMNRLQTKEELKERFRAGLQDEEEEISQRARRVGILEELEEVAEPIKTGVNELKQENQELFEELKEKRQEIKERFQVCAQVITPAINPQTGECREFGNPCIVPSDWQKVRSCSR